MRRDGIKTSLWQDVPTLVPQDQPSMTAYDVVVVGGGMTGVVTAYMLQKQGKKCLIAEAQNLSFGTTGGTTAHLNTLLDTPYSEMARNFGTEATRFVAIAASQAIRQVEENMQALNISCEFSRADAFLFSQSDSETKALKEILEAAKEAGLDASFTAELPIPVAFESAVNFKG